MIVAKSFNNKVLGVGTEVYQIYRARPEYPLHLVIGKVTKILDDKTIEVEFAQTGGGVTQSTKLTIPSRTVHTNKEELLKDTLGELYTNYTYYLPMNMKSILEDLKKHCGVNLDSEYPDFATFDPEISI